MELFKIGRHKSGSDWNVGSFVVREYNGSQIARVQCAFQFITKSINSLETLLSSYMLPLDTHLSVALKTVDTS